MYTLSTTEQETSVIFIAKLHTIFIAILHSPRLWLLFDILWTEKR
jgi:hypothetical protein